MIHSLPISMHLLCIVVMTLTHYTMYCQQLFLHKLEISDYTSNKAPKNVVRRRKEFFDEKEICDLTE